MHPSHITASNYLKEQKEYPLMIKSCIFILNQMMNNEIRSSWNIIHFLNFAAGLELRDSPTEQRFALKIIDFLEKNLKTLQDSSLEMATKDYYNKAIKCFLLRLKHNMRIRHSSPTPLHQAQAGNNIELQIHF